MRRYLMVDDNLAFAENIAEILREQGALVDVASCGEDALVAIAATRFDALITDMRMPRLGGAELVRQVRRCDPGLPVIVVSAWTEAGELDAAAEVGLLAVLPKPTPIDELLARAASARRDGLVLLIDDDEALVETLRSTLQLSGFSVLAAHSLSAVAKIGGEPLAAIVDLRLPGSADGAALPVLQKRFPQLPVFIITGHPGLAPEKRERLFVKPFDPEVLVAALERLHRSAA